MSSVIGLFRSAAREPLWSAAVCREAYEAARRSNCSNAASRARGFANAPAVPELDPRRSLPAFRVGEFTFSRFGDQQRNIAIIRESQAQRKQYSNGRAIIERVGL